MSGLLLLSFDHVFHVASPLLFLSALLFGPLPSDILFLLSLKCDRFCLLGGVQLALDNSICGNFFNLAIHLPFHCFFLLNFLLALLLLLLSHNVALSLIDDLRSSLARFINFFDNLLTKCVTWHSFDLPCLPPSLVNQYGYRATLNLLLLAFVPLWRHTVSCGG